MVRTNSISSGKALIQRSLLAITAALVMAFLPAIAEAARSVKVTSGNIREFTYIGTKAAYACRDTAGTKELGTLNKKQLRVGSKWSPLSPKQQEPAISALLGNVEFGLLSARSAKMRKELKKKAKQLRAELAQVRRALSYCPANGQGTPLPPNNPPGQNPLPPVEPPLSEIPQVEHLTISGSAIAGNIAGAAAANAIATLGSATALRIADASGGNFNFADVAPGEYFLKVEAPGVNFRSIKTLTVQGSPVAPSANVTFQGESVARDVLRYHWHDEPESYSGTEYSAFVNTPPQIEVLGERLEPVDAGAAQSLISQYKIYLSNELAPWNQESVNRLFETLETIPANSYYFKDSKWLLTNEALANDIDIRPLGEGYQVTISQAAFAHATPLVVNLNGERGRYFSKRLHHAAVRYLTQNGTDGHAVDYLLQLRFGVTTRVYHHTELTRLTTREDSSSFQEFKPEELLTIMSMLEEMPEGFHKAPGLSYLLRRKAGTLHPKTPCAAAIGWPRAAEHSYIEFMDKAFDLGDYAATQRLVLHEVSHFLYARTFASSLIQEWMDLGGWYIDLETGRWLTNKETEFVSDEAFKDPDNDMAESLSFFIVNPDWLMSRSPAKFNFIKERIMHGDRYVSQIREDLTFQVYNLSPDYVYPGKVKRLDLVVSGGPDQDKAATMEVELHAKDANLEGAYYGYAFLVSPSRKHYAQVYLRPTNANASGIGTILRSRFTLNKYLEKGNWTLEEFITYDKAYNSRKQKIRNFRMYLDNSLEQFSPPRYVANSLRISAEPEIVEGRRVTRVKVSFGVEAPLMRGTATAQLAAPGSQTLWQGTFYNAGSSTLNLEYIVTEFYDTGWYGLSEIWLSDEAGNRERFKFYDSPAEGQERLARVFVECTTPDHQGPELDVNHISISATPTHPEAPNGETSVTIKILVRDDLSGFKTGNFALRGPQGNWHVDYLEYSKSWTLFFDGDPTVWKEYTATTILPPGSAAGTWGLYSVVLHDKVNNVKDYNFTELMHFVVN